MGVQDQRVTDAYLNARKGDQVADYLSSLPMMQRINNIGQLDYRATNGDTTAAKGQAFDPQTYWGARMGDAAASARYNAATSPDAESDGEGGIGGFGGILVGLGVAFLTGGAGLAAAFEGAGMSSFGASIATGAVNGAITSTITGGDPLKGALTGGVGGAIGNYASGLEGGSNYMYGELDPAAGLVNPSNLTRAAGSGLLAAATGGNPLVAAGSSLAGSVAGAATDSPITGRIAGGVVGLIGSKVTGSNTAATVTPVVTTAPVGTLPNSTATNTYTGSGIGSIQPMSFASANDGLYAHLAALGVSHRL